MTTYPYQPPQREYADTLLAYRDFTMAGAWSARVEPDPLGPVNKIVSLWRGNRRVKAVLTRVPVDADVQVVRDEGGWTIDELFALKRGFFNLGATPAVEHRPAGWRIEVAGRTVLAVTDAETWPPTPPPPKEPLWQRMRQAWREQWRADVNKVMGRLGWHRDNECTGWDE